MKFFDWDKLINKELESPFIPEKKDNFDKRYCEENESISIDTKVRYEKYKNDNKYNKYFINFTYYGIISEYEEETKEINSLNHSINKKNNNIINIKKIEEKENEQNIFNLIDSNEETNINKNNKFINNIKKDDIEIKKQGNNILKNANNNYMNEKIENISIKKPIKNYSFVVNMKLSDNYKKENVKLKKENSEYLRNEEIQKQSMLLRNTSSMDNFSGSNTHRYKKIISDKNSRSKTPSYIEKKNFFLQSNNKRLGEYNNRIQNKSVRNNNKSLNQRSLKNQNQFNNNYYKENIRNLFSKKVKKKMNICSPGYYSKHSLQINSNTSKNNNLLLKRNGKSDFNKSPIGSITSIDASKNTKSPKFTTSTSTSLKGYMKRSKNVTPLNKNNKYLRHNNSAKNIHNNFINDKSKNSRVNLSNLYNQNFSYVKRIKEMNSFNYNNKLKESNINNKNSKRTNDIISSYCISSSNILKQIRNTNYNKNKVNIINKNNPLVLYNNANNNQRLKQNNKISLELELNADSQTFSKNNKINNKNEFKSNNRKSNSNLSIKKDILNKNHSTINISSMKMDNGNININVVIKGNNNTTNLINKIEVKKKNYENNLKNKNMNKKFQRSHSTGFFNLKL